MFPARTLTLNSSEHGSVASSCSPAVTYIGPLCMPKGVSNVAFYYCVYTLQPGGYDPKDDDLSVITTWNLRGKYSPFKAMLICPVIKIFYIDYFGDEYMRKNKILIFWEFFPQLSNLWPYCLWCHSENPLVITWKRAKLIDFSLAIQPYLCREVY